jgi:hypothetical protein
VGDPVDRVEGERDGLWNGQIQPDQPMQALGAAPVAVGRDIRLWRDFGKANDIRVFLHCSVPLPPAEYADARG